MLEQPGKDIRGSSHGVKPPCWRRNVPCSESVHWEIVETTVTPQAEREKHKMKTDCIN